MPNFKKSIAQELFGRRRDNPIRETVLALNQTKEWWKAQAETWKRKFEDAELSFDAERRYLLHDNVIVERYPDLEDGFFRVECKNLAERLGRQRDTIDELRKKNESLDYQLETCLDENRELSEANDLLRAEADVFQELFHAQRQQKQKSIGKSFARWWNHRIDKDYSVTWGEYVVLVTGGCVLGSLLGWVLGEISYHDDR